MLKAPFGPHGAEEERNGFWTDLGEVRDNAYQEELPAAHSPAGLNAPAAQEPYGPALTPDLMPDADSTADAQTNASRQDPLGSWTGVPEDDAGETPTQDADDL